MAKEKKLKTIEQTICVKDNALPLKTCEKIIKAFEEMKRIGRTGTGETQGGVQNDIKTTNDMNLFYQRDEYLHDLGNECCEIANKEINNFLGQFGQLEKWDYKEIWKHGSGYDYMNVQKYDKGIGHYHGWHTEQNYDQETSQRLFTVMFYLNDIEEGGETVFPMADVSIKPKAGTFVCFPCGWPYVHYGDTPISDDKYIVTGWLEANWGRTI